MDGGDLPSATASLEPLARGDQTAAAAGDDGPDRLPECCDAMAGAILAMLSAVMREFGSRADAAARSQDGLAQAIDRLTGELDKLLEDAPSPLIMQHATKISSIRRRVSTLNLLLKSIQRRIDNIDRLFSTGMPMGST